jgi:hypothetical membrane protein
MSPQLKRMFGPKPTAIYGIIGPLLAFICIIIAISVSPWFVWADNALSDLGHPTEYPSSPQSSMYFNNGLIIAGIICALFVIGLGYVIGFGAHVEKKAGLGAGGKVGVSAGFGFGLKVEKNIVLFVATALLFVGTIALVCIGLFPESMPPWHFIFSVILFVTIALSLLVFGIAFMLKPQTRILGVISFILGIVAASPWIVRPWPGVAIPETISAVAVYIWILIVCVMLTAGKQIKSKK